MHSSSNSTSENKDLISEIQKEGTEKIDDMVKIVGRSDFCGGYMGQSALKTQALLLASLGKVLFIDEAYSLVHD